MRYEEALKRERAKPLGRRPGPAQYRAAVRRVRQRLGSGAPPSHRPAPERALSESPDAGNPRVGRWALVHRFGLLGKDLPVGERIARQARQLLARYGIVTRESLAGESGSWEWPLILRQLQRLEMRGEVRRGYFVQGLPGLQFALPEAVERLRALRDGSEDKPEVVLMNADDPANLYGPARDDGPTTVQGQPLAFSRVPSTWLVLHRGLPVLVAGDSGANLVIPQGTEDGLVRRALVALLDHLAHFERRVAVETWNEEPVLQSDERFLLESAGFYRSYPAMVWERPF